MLSTVKLPSDWSTIKKLLWLRAHAPVADSGVEKTVSGNAPLAFSHAKAAPLIKFTTNIEPVQDLHGYDSPWPAGGGKNKYNTAETAWSDGTVILNDNGNPTTSVASHYTTNYTKVVPSTGYTLSGTIVYGTTLTGRIYFYDSDKHWISRTSATQFNDADGVQFTTPATCEYIQIQTASETTADWMLEIGSTPSVWTPYSNLCPISGWNEVNVIVSPTTEAEDGRTYTIEMPTEAGTVYGGELTVNKDGSGSLVVDRANIASYNGETLSSTWISDRDVYVAGTTPTIGAQVVYKLVSPITYTFTATQIKALKGDNYIWTDCGDTLSVTYKVDAPLQTLTAEGVPPLALSYPNGKPLKSWSVSLTPYQEGTGDPSPDNVRTIHGTDKVTVWTTGKNLFSDRFSDYTKPNDYYICPIDLPNGYIYVNAELVGEAMTGIVVGVVEDGTRYNNFVNQRNVINTSGSIVAYNTNVINWPSPKLIVYCSGEEEFNQIFENYHISLCFGSTATDYVPYITPSQTVITLPQTVYNGTVGSDGGEIKWGMADLGTLNWAYITNDGEPYFAAYVNETVPTGYEKKPGLNQICSCYKTASSTGTGSMRDMEIGATGSNNSRVFVKDSRYTDLPSFITFATGQQLVYQLETPAQFSHTAPAIPTTKGDCTVWATAEDGTVDSMSVTYKGHVMPE